MSTLARIFWSKTRSSEPCATTTAVRCRGASSAIVLGLILALSAAPGFAQVVDENLWVVDGTVRSVVRAGGTIYVGGAFGLVGPATGGGVPIDNLGAVPYGSFPKVTGQVYDVIPDGSGGWYIGGLFTAVGGVPRSNLAHVVGGAVSSWNPSANYIVYALAKSGSTIYVGGSFNNVGGQPRSCIAALDATTGAATAWDPSANGVVYALVVSGSTIYAGGGFTGIGGQTRSCIAALDAASGNATSWNPAASNWVWALALKDSALYVGGDFKNIGGQARNRIAALDATSGTAFPWNPNADTLVTTLLVSGSTIYAGGFFTDIGGQARNHIAALDAVSGNATLWNPNANSWVEAIVQSGPDLYVGGGFTAIGGQPRDFLAAISAATGTVTGWNPGPNLFVSALAVSGGIAYAGGYFTSVGGVSRNGLAALDASTGAATSWNPDPDGVVTTLGASGSTVYVGGYFGVIGGQARPGIAALDAATGAATSWNPNPNGVLQSLAVSGNTVYAGGYFTTIGGQPRTYLAALDASTGLATAWNPNADNYILTVAVAGNTVYAGGIFANIGGQPRADIAAIDATTGSATSWNPGANADVRALAVSGSTVYAGGYFTSIGGQTRNYIAALDATTGAATAWNADADAQVSALVVDGSTLYVGGGFANIGGQPRAALAAVSATTGTALPWNPNGSGTVYSVAVGGSTVYAGGFFARFGGLPLSDVAAIAAVPEVVAAQPASGGNSGVMTVTLVGLNFRTGATVRLSRSGQSNRVGTGVVVAAGGSSLVVTFDLTGAVTGAWDVVVINPDAQTATLAGGFTVTSVTAPQLRVSLLGPELIRANQRTAFDLVVTNPGNVDAVGVPLWLTGIPTDATVELDFPLSYPTRDAGEPDWTTVPLGFTSPGGRYLDLVIPRVPPGTTVRRVFLNVPATVSSFEVDAAVTPPWVDGTVFRNCLSAGGVISNPACMGAQLTAISTYLASNPSLLALSGIGVWAKVAWQCEGATTLPQALTRAEQVLDYMVQPVEVPGSAIGACSNVLPPRWRDTLIVTIVTSIDPNDKLGLQGSLPLHQAIPYEIRFENLSTATAPAQQVVISDPLDVSKLDPNSVSLDVITFGSVHIVPPPGLRSYATQVDLRPGRNLLVNVSAAVDPFTGVLTWYFTSIDPATGQPPTDPLAGFMPPNNAQHEGEGSVLFTVMPQPTLGTGVQISNAASITFDGNAPHATPVVTNLVDNTAPASHVLPLAANSDLPNVPVSWTTDGAPQDLRDFTVYVSEDGAPYRVWRLNVAVANDTLVPPGNHRPHTYAFYSVARDVNGNIEAAPSGADATTQSRTAVGEPAGPLALALEGARPNPALSTLRVWFTLQNREAAWLEVIDVAGRRVLRREVGSLGPGVHSVTLDDTPPLRPGLYFLRLAQGPHVLSTRAAIIQ
jgi:hypothetical protein